MKNSFVHFVWSEFFKEKLLFIGVKKNLIFVTGNIRTDTTFQVSTNRKVLSQEFEIDINKKWILFSENRGWVLTSNKKRRVYDIFMVYKRGCYRKEKIAKKSLEYTIREMNELTDNFFKRYELIYRHHPGTKAPLSINSRIKVIDKYPIYEWINSVDLNLVWSSTAIFESDIKKVPSIVCEPIQNLKRHKTYGLENYQTISSFNEINDELIEEYKETIAPKKIYEKCIGKVDGKSIFRVREVILNEGIKDYRAKPMIYSKKNYYRRYIFQKITRLFVKLNLLEIFKYPKSAYKLRNDIPYRKKIK